MPTTPDTFDILRQWRRNIGGAAMLAMGACASVAPSQATTSANMGSESTGSQTGSENTNDRATRSVLHRSFPTGSVGVVTPADVEERCYASMSLVMLMDRPRNDGHVLFPIAAGSLGSDSVYNSVRSWASAPHKAAEEFGRLCDRIAELERSGENPNELAERTRLHEELRFGTNFQEGIVRRLLELPPARHAIFVRDGNIEVASSPSDLGPIDCPVKALFAMWLAGIDFHIQSTAVEASRGGFEVTLEASMEVPGLACHSRLERRERRVQINRDGTLVWHEPRLVSSEEIDHCGPDDREILHQRGRRTEGAELNQANSNLRSYLQGAANEEAEAVVAFERLARELAHHGASQALIDAASSAADDERRHVEAFANIASHFGFRIKANIPWRPLPCRDLESILIENTIEGCVNETYAAAEAMHQGRHAADPFLRRHFAHIAKDEVGHAALAHAIEAELAQKLSNEAQQRLHQANTEARRRLASSDRQDPKNIQSLLGTPTPAFRRAFLESLPKSN